jgi:hypothetical protein
MQPCACANPQGRLAERPSEKKPFAKGGGTHVHASVQLRVGAIVHPSVYANPQGRSAERPSEKKPIAKGGTHVRASVQLCVLPKRSPFCLLSIQRVYILA